ncbi:TPM domain-containing protein [Faecalibacterium taiwanense]|uniref:TPM domain-containing protein n=1 Tax=Faecalibacterium taiwanense TaxID=3030638 RepID=UPI00321AA824
MKNFAKRVSALVLALVVGAAALCPAALAAASLPDLPKDECVVDDANILSDSTTQTIVDLNNQLQSSCNGAQIGVLTVDYTGNYSTEDYATQALNAWGIGSASENNGVLILLVMESPIYEDGDYYVTYGDGFRNTTLESQASALAQTMEGDFVNRDYSDAVITCANNVADTIASVYGVNLNNGSYDDGSYAEPDDGPTTFEDVVLGIVILFMSLMVMLIIVLFVFRVFIAPIGHAAGWNWGPFAWGYMAGSARRHRPGPPPLRAPASAPDTARAMAPAPAMTGPARPGTTTGVRPVLPWAAALAAGPSVAPAEVAPLGAARSAAAPSVEWAAAAATAAAVVAAVKNTKTRRTAVGGMPAAVLFLGFRREGNSFDKSTLLTYTEKHA